MKVFDVNKSIRVVAQSSGTRSGFKHEATLFVNGQQRETVKINYLNRTWERYEFESVLEKLLEKTTSLNDAGKKALAAFIKRDNTDWSGFQQTARVAALGDLFGRTPKEKNDWKARMLKAGLGSSGLEMPEDWDSLPEAEKKRRLDGAIKMLKRRGV
jgi:predicted nucleic-acid-binding protein